MVFEASTVAAEVRGGTRDGGRRDAGAVVQVHLVRHRAAVQVDQHRLGATRWANQVLKNYRETKRSSLDWRRPLLHIGGGP